MIFSFSELGCEEKVDKMIFSFSELGCEVKLESRITTVYLHSPEEIKKISDKLDRYNITYEWTNKGLDIPNDKEAVFIKMALV